MSDLKTLLQSSPPPEIAEQLLDQLNNRLRAYLSASDKEITDDLLRCVAVGLRIHAGSSIQHLGTLLPTRSDLLPLEVLIKLIGKVSPTLDKILPTLALDAALAYPIHVSSVNQLLTGQFENNALMANTFKQEVILATVRLLERENAKFMKGGSGLDEIELHLPKLVYSLLLYARAHPILCSAILDARNFFDIIKLSYDVVSKLPDTVLDLTRRIQTKSHLLLLLHTVLAPSPPSDREWRLEMMEDDGAKGNEEILINAGFARDYHVLFVLFQQKDEATRKSTVNQDLMKDLVGEVQMEALRSLSAGLKISNNRKVRDETAMIKVDEEQRISPILILFPNIPADLLHEALRHPRYAAHTGASGSEDDAVTILTNAMLDNTLPPELDALGRLVRQVAQQDDADRGEGGRRNSNGSRDRSGQASPDKGTKKFKRDNIFNDLPMDFSKLSFGKNESDLDNLTSSIPEHIRASIMRLTEQQRDEEEVARELEREEAKARRARTGGASSSKMKDTKIRTVAFEEELGEDELLDDETDALIRLNMREGEGGSSDGESYVNSEEDDDIGAGGSDDVYLEQLYLQNPKAFDRDGITRRSKMREQMRQQTGWSDEQLEGWKIMLERNPLKEKILSRHGDPRSNRGANDGRPSLQGRGSGRGGGGERGKAGGGRGGGGAGGGGRGRGGASKSSRGHSNAARTRGHDKKMARMGAV